MGKIATIVLYWTIFISNADSKHLSQREKRFVLQPADKVIFQTPTTYKVPAPRNQITTNSIPILQPIITGSSLMNSIKVQCPHKRSVGFHRVFLDENLMKELYLELVGDIDHSSFAGSLDDADDNFRHILTLSANKTHHRHHHKSQKRADFIRDLTKYQTWYDTAVEEVYKNNNTSTDSSPPLDGPTDKLEDMMKRIGVTKHQLKQLLGLVHDIDDIKDFRLSNKRIKRDTIGAVQSRTEYCNQRGTRTGTGYFHMCSACAMTTQFPEDMFPRYINEVTCDASDCDCFQAQNTANGKCQPIVKNMKMLKRGKGGCRLIIKNGQQTIVDDWELYEQPLHVGCECMFKTNSLFARFIPKH